jgi:hypothetical protein
MLEMLFKPFPRLLQRAFYVGFSNCVLRLLRALIQAIQKCPLQAVLLWATIIGCVGLHAQTPVGAVSIAAVAQSDDKAAQPAGDSCAGDFAG